MSSFKNLALAAALGATFLCDAHASDFYATSYLLTNRFADTAGTTAQYYAVSRATTDEDGNAVPSLSAGDTFVDDFMLWVNDTDTYSVSITTAGVSFDSVVMNDLWGYTYDFSSADLTGSGFVGSGLSLQPGVYNLELTGTATADGGNYHGALADAAGIAAVPEPQTWAMVLLGLGAFGFAGRRRRGVCR